MEDCKVKQTFCCVFFFLLINFSYWIIVDLQCCVSFCLYSKMSHLCLHPLAFRFYPQVLVQSLSHAQLFATPWTAAHQASLSITNFRNLHKLISISLVIPSNHLILCRPLVLLPSTFPASGSFPRSQFFVSGGQSIGVSASASVLPVNTQD